MIALLQRLHARPDIDDDARALVAEDRREQAFGIRAGARELIGVADAGGLDLDQHFAGPRTVEIHGDDFERLARGVGDCSLRFHLALPVLRYSGTMSQRDRLRHTARTRLLCSLLRLDQLAARVEQRYAIAA